jgi:hypothetical protein
MTSCGLFDKNETVINNISEEVKIDLWQSLQPNGAQFQLRLSTLDELECPETHIIHTHQIQNNRIFLELFNIDRPSNCQPEINTVFTTIPLNIQPGFYDFSLKLGELLEHQGNLQEWHDRYQLNLQTTDGIHIPANELFKIPSFTIWGYINSPGNNDLVIQKFMQEIDELVSDRPLYPGYYGHFTFDENLIAIQNEPATGYNYRFLFRLDGSTENLEDFILDFRDRHGQEIAIKCLTWDGREF